MTAAAPGVVTAPAPAGTNRWLVLVLVCLAQFRAGNAVRWNGPEVCVCGNWPRGDAGFGSETLEALE